MFTTNVGGLARGARIVAGLALRGLAVTGTVGVWGYIGLVEGILKRMRREVAPVETLIATGGLAPVLAKDCPSVDVSDENLTLEGLRILYERNKG
jgi:type III pantothenate kinase